MRHGWCGHSVRKHAVCGVAHASPVNAVQHGSDAHGWQYSAVRWQTLSFPCTSRRPTNATFGSNHWRKLRQITSHQLGDMQIHILARCVEAESLRCCRHCDRVVAAQAELKYRNCDSAITGEGIHVDVR